MLFFLIKIISNCPSFSSILDNKRSSQVILGFDNTGEPFHCISLVDARIVLKQTASSCLVSSRNYFENLGLNSFGRIGNSLRVAYNYRGHNIVVFRHSDELQQSRILYTWSQTNPTCSQSTCRGRKHKITGCKGAIHIQRPHLLWPNKENETRSVVKHIKTWVTQGCFVF